VANDHTERKLKIQENERYTRSGLIDSGTATIVGAVIGGLVGIGGSLGAITLQQWRKRNEERENAKKYLIAELEQNREYQAFSDVIRLEDSAYKRFRQAGFYDELSADLQSQLRHLYTLIHEKSEMVDHYNSIALAAIAQNATPSFGSIETTRQGIRNNIAESQTGINDLINQILPQLKALLDY
jgi:hypothetical protein